MTIFDFSDHYEYLSQKLRSPRGRKTKLAAALRVPPAYLSQVLGRRYALSLEQAALVNQFLEHSVEESEFFLLLVGRDRAGNEPLREHYAKQIKSILSKRQLVVERLGKRPGISEEVKGKFYSSWLYPAVHVACTIPRLRTRREIARELGLPPAVVGRVLEFLLESQILAKDGDRYVPTENWLRLDKDSPHIMSLHRNWRQRAVQNLEVQTDQDLHYSGVFSVDEKTALRVKDRLLDFWKTQLKEFEAAPEEQLFVVGMDFFRLVHKE